MAEAKFAHVLDNCQPLLLNDASKAYEMSGNTFPVTALLADSTIYSANYNGYNVNTATVTGLEPDTTYQYMVGNEEGWSAMHSFRTAKSGELRRIFSAMRTRKSNPPHACIVAAATITAIIIKITVTGGSAGVT